MSVITTAVTETINDDDGGDDVVVMMVMIMMVLLMIMLWCSRSIQILVGLISGQLECVHVNSKYIYSGILFLRGSTV